MNVIIIDTLVTMGLIMMISAGAYLLGEYRGINSKESDFEKDIKLGIANLNMKKYENAKKFAEVAEINAKNADQKLLAYIVATAIDDYAKEHDNGEHIPF